MNVNGFESRRHEVSRSKGSHITKEVLYFYDKIKLTYNFDGGQVITQE